jgi:hypothetical protein
MCFFLDLGTVSKRLGVYMLKKTSIIGTNCHF